MRLTGQQIRTVLTSLIIFMITISLVFDRLWSQSRVNDLIAIRSWSRQALTGGPKCRSSDLLVICRGHTPSRNPTPKTVENLQKYKLSTTHIPTKTVTNLLLFMTPKGRIYLTMLDITKRHDTNDDKAVHSTCFHTGHPLKSPASSCLQL